MHNSGMIVEPDAYILSVEQAVARLLSGGVVALPTDTVYGIAVDYRCARAVERLFAIKGRDAAKPIPLLISDLEKLAALATGVDHRALALVERLWPGALTVIVGASDSVPDAIRRGQSTVGVRMPDCAITLQIIAEVGGVLAVTSANRSGESEARSAEEVRQSLGNLVDGVIDGGRSPQSQPSSVVDLSGDSVLILREGTIPATRIHAILREVDDG